MLARPLLTITIVPNPASLPLLGGLVASLPLWASVPEAAAWVTGFLVAFRVRVQLTRRPTHV
ncbi:MULTISPECIES: hypothetical protein [Streptomyces]|uniref:Uncharacterized protein n=1 Tax=Streptomyces galbus TaxID=33898 RepID=A0ABX1IN12_STRGB|nr:hypothetical protein [Streptomyces galbus]NKQ26924.1 hypothetical protein [Streptomyces galbus]